MSVCRHYVFFFFHIIVIKTMKIPSRCVYMHDHRCSWLCRQNVFSYTDRITSRCVYLYDHHCSWLNNCIGAGNLRFFFLVSVFTTSVFTTSVFTTSVFTTRERRRQPPLFLPGICFFLVISVVVYYRMCSLTTECVLFLVSVSSWLYLWYL